MLEWAMLRKNNRINNEPTSGAFFSVSSAFLIMEQTFKNDIIAIKVNYFGWLLRLPDRSAFNRAQRDWQSFHGYAGGSPVNGTTILMKLSGEKRPFRNVSLDLITELKTRNFRDMIMNASIWLE